MRQALALLIDKDSVEKHIYGRTGRATANFIYNPERFRSKNTKYEFNVDKAIDILEKAGWKKGADGIREKDGKKLKYLYQTSINQPRQKTQAIVKQACQKAGIEIEIKSVTASVFFSSDVANPDTYPHFYADLQMYNNGPQQPDPAVFLQPVLLVGGRHQGQQVAGPQHHALAEQGIRRHLQGLAERARSGEARGHDDQDERHGREQPRRDPRGRPAGRHRREQQAHLRAERLGHQHLGPGELVPGGLRAALDCIVALRGLREGSVQDGRSIFGFPLGMGGIRWTNAICVVFCDQVKAGRMSRRAFVQRMAVVGLTAPMATQLLALSGVAMAQPRPTYKPTKRGGGGLLKVLWWQGPTLLNPHFAVGTKDQDGSRLFYEPLARWDRDGNLQPVLAETIPGREDGTLAADGKSVTWKLKKGVRWHDGKPFTADDVVFTWEYARDPATATLTSGSYNDVTVEKIDPYTVVVKFQEATPFWADAFVAAAGCIIPKHLFADYVGEKSREAPANLKPVGTGPYKFKDFKPGDLVAGVINPDYHMENRPHFDAIEMKGGGDAVSAARAVLQTGEFDFGWNMQVEDEILTRLEKGGKGRHHHQPRRRHRAHPAQQHRPLDRGRRRALQSQDHAPDPVGSGGAPGCGAADRQGLDREAHLRPHREQRRRTSSTTRSASLPRRRSTSSTSTRRTPSSTRPAGPRAPTAFGQRTARS